MSQRETADWPEMVLTYVSAFAISVVIGIAQMAMVENGPLRDLLFRTELILTSFGTGIGIVLHIFAPNRRADDIQPASRLQAEPVVAKETAVTPGQSNSTEDRSPAEDATQKQALSGADGARPPKHKDPPTEQEQVEQPAGQGQGATRGTPDRSSQGWLGSRWARWLCVFLWSVPCLLAVVASALHLLDGPYKWRQAIPAAAPWVLAAWTVVLLICLFLSSRCDLALVRRLVSGTLFAMTAFAVVAALVHAHSLLFERVLTITVLPYQGTATLREETAGVTVVVRNIGMFELPTADVFLDSKGPREQEWVQHGPQELKRLPPGDGDSKSWLSTETPSNAYQPVTDGFRTYRVRIDLRETTTVREYEKREGFLKEQGIDAVLWPAIGH